MTDTADADAPVPARVPPLTTLTISSGTYKSISGPLEWPDIPQFAVLTGENGTGKTQLLQTINGKFHPPTAGKQDPFAGITLRFSGWELQAKDVVFVPTMSSAITGPRVGLHELQQQLNSLVDRALGKQQGGQKPNAYEREALRRIKEMLPSSLPPTGVFELLGSDILYSSPAQVAQSMTHHFVNYWLRHVNRKVQGSTDQEILHELGLPPWRVFNDLLVRSGLPYELTTPEHMDIRERFALRLRDTSTGREVDVADVSSGQATVLRLYMWLFVANQHFSFPSLILLDEPDSHLHPTLIKAFLDSLIDGIVDRLGGRVIMTTHRSETIAFAPQESLFEMHAQEPRIRRSGDRQTTMLLVTRNFVALLADGRRPVYVEDEGDSEFYGLAIALLEEEQAWTQLAKPEFIPASLGKGKGRTSGGKHNVRKWVDRLSNGGLNGIVKGLIDRDVKNVATRGIVVLDRYSFENYLLDPLVVYTFLVDTERDRPLDLSPPIRFGEQGRIREREQYELQRIADAVTSVVEPRLTPAPEGRELDAVQVEYWGRRKVTVPKWLIDRNSREMMQAYRGAWPGITWEGLLRAYKELRLVPCTLKSILDRCVIPP